MYKTYRQARNKAQTLQRKEKCLSEHKVGGTIKINPKHAMRVHSITKNQKLCRRYRKTRREPRVDQIRKGKHLIGKVQGYFSLAGLSLRQTGKQADPSDPKNSGIRRVGCDRVKHIK